MSGVSFSIVRHAAWAPSLATPEAWLDWSRAPTFAGAEGEPGLKAMPPMLRRRAAQLGKMALEVAYECLGDAAGVPIVYCSRHGEVGRSIELLDAMARGEALSPTAFGMSVHNANPGLFTIARKEQANHIALAAGASSLEHAVIEACGLLADGAPQVLLVMADTPLPELYGQFEDCERQAFAFAWLLQAPGGAGNTLSLRWAPGAPAIPGSMPGALQVLRFFLAGEAQMVRMADQRQWQWQRHV
ncbi:beta-ketoacyl synthase chain length factor [Pseudoduganella violaceinigra]|uniref:beta-ketoacyl synthase chain length factor n=1 Tax=Pseudoduganella violaceinigra TaxID=246602 RepID=UPI000488AE49|nr:beta-ketoacyl synthase chain length factor [Pseudoduganella violaceinigra]